MVLGILIAVTIFLFVLIILFLIDVFFSFYLSVPSLSSNNKSILRLLSEMDLKKVKTFYDLGSGSGKIITQVSRRYPELRCTGIELNPLVYSLSIFRNRFSKNKAVYFRKDFFEVDLAEADVVYCFLFPGIMEKLEEKLAREMKNGAVVISSCFPLKNKKADKIIQGEKRGLDTLYVYRY